MIIFKEEYYIVIIDKHAKRSIVIEVKTTQNKYSKEFLLNKGNNSCIMNFKDCNILLEDIKIKITNK